jgi:Secretion system C-terminal sorting domain
MKKLSTILTTLCFSLSFLSVDAQTKDTVSMGAGYANMVWYDIENDVETKLPATSWDISIGVRPFDASVGINANNTTITSYQPVNSLANWATVTASDTSKLINVTYNSDSLFSVGAFNSTNVSGKVFDYGWGSYTQATNSVNGDSVYIIKTIKGEWKKLAIEALRYDTIYIVKYANLDGTNEKKLEVKKKDYPKKNFVYLSLSEDKIINPEPNNDKWDLLFTKYHGLALDPMGKYQHYTLTGVLQNTYIINERGVNKAYGTLISKVTRKDLANDNFDLTKLRTEINTIGTDWKNNDRLTGLWTVSDSTTYFLKNNNAKYYKINFTGFGGVGNGNFIFNRKNLVGVSVKDVYAGVASLSVYPNPSNGNNLTVVYDLGKNAQKADFQLVNSTGQTVFAQKLQNTEGVQQLALPQLTLSAGIYFAVLQWNGQSAIQKVIIR